MKQIILAVMAVTVIAGPASAGFFDNVKDAFDPDKNGTNDAFEQLDKDTDAFMGSNPKLSDFEDW